MHIGCRDANLSESEGLLDARLLRRIGLARMVPLVVDSSSLSARHLLYGWRNMLQHDERGWISIIETCVSWPPSPEHAASCRPATWEGSRRNETLQRARVESQDANAAQWSIHP
ncbi:hypothetical protein CGRA01v4_03638 [Colletotrichum graminicola]|nr:hypothetical protein CGRA01v4_03638 [Colletotrichum graminicola]